VTWRLCQKKHMLDNVLKHRSQIFFAQFIMYHVKLKPINNILIRQMYFLEEKKTYKKTQEIEAVCAKEVLIDISGIFLLG
jgi:hypothetical protein